MITCTHTNTTASGKGKSQSPRRLTFHRHLMVRNLWRQSYRPPDFRTATVPVFLRMDSVSLPDACEVAGVLVCPLYVVGNLKENFKNDTLNENKDKSWWAGIHELHNVHICVCTSKRDTEYRIYTCSSPIELGGVSKVNTKHTNVPCFPLRNNPLVKGVNTEAARVEIYIQTTVTLTQDKFISSCCQYPQ